MNRTLTGTLSAIALGGALLAPSLGHAAPTRGVVVVNITPNNFVSTFPTQLVAGTIKLRLTTPGKQDQTSVNLAQLRPGVRPATIRTLMRAGKLFPALGMLRLAGGVDSLHGTTQVGLFNLSPGTYVVFSLDRMTANKNPGSPSTFVTVAGPGSGPSPLSVATITAVDFRFHGPANLPAGSNVIKFVNMGKEPHELVLVGIAPNKTLADVKMALMQSQNGPPPAWIRNVGGWGVLSPGSAMWVQPNLSPGKYVLLCFVPDAFSYPGHKATNKPHVMLGMVRLIHVR